MGTLTTTQVTTPDDRVLEVLDAGPDAGFPLLFHSGTPSAAVTGSPVEAAAEAAALRLVTYSRPGYGGSTPWPHHRRPVSVSDDVPDSLAVLESLDIGDFVTLGWSGGGPRALACAALVPERCRAAALLAGAAPFHAEGLDFLAGMGPENVRDFAAAAEGAEAVRPHLEDQVTRMATLSGEQVVEALEGLVDEVDAAALTGDFADYVAATMRAAARQGVTGLLDDTMALVVSWGFDLAEISVPVAVWHGRHDLMVPFAHGLWLADHVPGARPHLHDEEGHVSLVLQADRILADLKELAGL